MQLQTQSNPQWPEKTANKLRKERKKAAILLEVTAIKEYVATN